MDTYTTTTVNTTSAGVGMVWIIAYLALVVLMIVALWKMFEKAGEKGWKSLIPVYNTYILFKLAGRNGWGFLLLFVPFVNFVVLVMISIDLAKHFGKSTAFGVLGLLLFPYVGYTMLGLGEAKYVGPKHA